MIVRFGVHAHEAMESGTLLTGTMWDFGGCREGPLIG